MGDIVIKAAEAWSVKKDNSIAKIKTQNDVPRYYSSIAEAENKIKDSKGASVELLADITGKWDISGADAEIDLCGFKAEYGGADSYVFNVKNSNLKIVNGLLNVTSAYGGVWANNSCLTLGNNVKVTSDKVGVELSNGGKLIADGAEISGSSYSVYSSDEGCSLVVKSGTFTNPVRICGKNPDAKLYGGTFDSIYCDDGVDYLTLLANGYAYKSTSEETRTIDEMLGTGYIEHFSVEKSPFAYSEKKKQVDFGFADNIKLESGVTAEFYQWYVNGKAIADATESTYVVGTGISSGKYEYVCAVSDGEYYAPVMKMSLIVYCPHGELDASGKCAHCRTRFCAEVTNKGELPMLFENLYEALEMIQNGGEIKLLSDVELADYDGSMLEINKYDIVFDLNDKIISDETKENRMMISGSATMKNGTLDLYVYAAEGVRGITLENLKLLSFAEFRTEKVNIVSGEYFGLAGLYSMSKYIADGKALKSGDEWIDMDETYNCENVEVVPAPVRFAKQPKQVHIKDENYTDGGTISVEVKKSEGYESEPVSYQWYTYSNYESTPIDGETKSIFNVPLGIEAESGMVYYCRISCAGYSRNSQMVPILVGSAEPYIMFYKEDSEWNIEVDGDGLIGDIVIAGYDENGRMVSVETQKLTVEDECYYYADIFNELGFSRDLKKIKAFLFDDINNMSPLCRSEELILGAAKPNIKIYGSGSKCFVDVDGNGAAGDVIIAGYDENGKMADISTARIESDDNGYSAEIFDELGFSENVKIVKVFLFDDINNMIPLCESKEQGL